MNIDAFPVFEVRKYYKDLPKKREWLASFVSCKFNANACFSKGPRHDTCAAILSELMASGNTQGKRNRNWNAAYTAEKISLMLLLFNLEEKEKKKAAVNATITRDSSKTDLRKIFIALKKRRQILL